MDKRLKAEIMEAVNKGVQEAMLTYEERWLTSEQLLEQFGMLSKDWMRRNAWRLPRGRFEFVDENGQVSTRWAYPQHRIAQMIKEL